MTQMDVSKIVDRAKEALGIEQDQELAARLGVDRTTIASWKRRASIPAKYLSQMLDGGRISFDWLMTGRGRKEQVNEFGLSDEADLVDQEVLWVALRSVAADLYAFEDGPGEQVGAWLLESDNLATVHIRLSDYLKRVQKSKEKWERSGIVTGSDVYRALVTEFQAGGTYDDPKPPWWRDETVI